MFFCSLDCTNLFLTTTLLWWSSKKLQKKEQLFLTLTYLESPNRIYNYHINYIHHYIKSFGRYFYYFVMIMLWIRNFCLALCFWENHCFFMASASTGGTRNTAYLFEQQKTKKIPVVLVLLRCDKRRKLTQASKAKKIMYKDRKWSSYWNCIM